MAIRDNLISACADYLWKLGMGELKPPNQKDSDKFAESDA